MPNFDFGCPSCETRHEIWRTLADAKDPAHCPSCETEMARIWDADSVPIVLDLRPSWSEGHTIFQLPKNCPDRHVTSQKQMDKVYVKHGIDPDTHAPFPGQKAKSSAHNWRKK